MSYIPEPAFEPSQEWVTRELYRISDTIDRILAGHRNVRIISVCTYTVNQDDNVILMNAPGIGCGEAAVLTLPSVVDPRVLFIKKIDNNFSLTIATAGSETIDGAAEATLATQYQSIMLASDGSNWHEIAANF